MNRVKELRKTMGLTQAELAKKAGVARQTIIELERETKPTVHWWTMKKVADALGGSVTDIFFS